MARYRLYVDESGDHTYKDVGNPDSRYLGLTGLAVENDYYRDIFHPQLEKLKQKHFPHNPDEPVVLVRSNIVGRRGPFGLLRDPDRNAAWEHDILSFFGLHIKQIFTVVIDKQEHRKRYGDAAYHPYHHCFTVLLERYRGWLSAIRGKGDVLVESRGGTEDTLLKDYYADRWNNGTYYISAQQFQNVFTSRELKVKKKYHNIAGLQVTDLIAYPSKIDILLEHDRTLARPPGHFTSTMNSIIRSKYNRYGRELL